MKHLIQRKFDFVHPKSGSPGSPDSAIFLGFSAKSQVEHVEPIKFTLDLESNANLGYTVNTHKYHIWFANMLFCHKIHYIFMINALFYFSLPCFAFFFCIIYSFFEHHEWTTRCDMPKKRFKEEKELKVKKIISVQKIIINNKISALLLYNGFQPGHIATSGTSLLPFRVNICFVSSIMENSIRRNKQESCFVKIPASIGNFAPQKYVWKTCIALHSAPR